jgi:hypothetical protein
MKVTIQWASLILVVMHNLCYWTSNKPIITSDFSRRQYTPKFTHTDICIFDHIWVHSFRRCYTLLVPNQIIKLYNNVDHRNIIQIFVKKTCGKKKVKRKKTLQIGINVMLGLSYLMPDCWLVVSLHPEGSATGQLDQGFQWFTLVPEQMLSWYPNSALHRMFRI